MNIWNFSKDITFKNLTTEIEILEKREKERQRERGKSVTFQRGVECPRMHLERRGVGGGVGLRNHRQPDRLSRSPRLHRQHLRLRWPSHWSRRMDFPGRLLLLLYSRHSYIIFIVSWEELFVRKWDVKSSWKFIRSRNNFSYAFLKWF